MLWNEVPVADDSGGTPNYGSSVTAATGRPSQDVLKKYLIDKYGLTPAGASGMLRNAYVDESGGDPLAVGDSGTSFGLFQEHASRAGELAKYAQDNDRSAGDPYTQVDFAMEETKTKFPDLYKTLTSTTDENVAHDDFRRIFERPAKLSSGLGPGSVRFSGYALDEAGRRRNTDLVSMSPSDYLAMSPPLDDPWTDKSGKSLLGSLKAGDAIEQVPSLTVGKNGTVTDQDGRHRALAAQDAGMEDMPVALQRTSTQPLTGDLTGMQGTSIKAPTAAHPSKFSDWLVPRAEAAEPTARIPTQPTAPLPALTPQGAPSVQPTPVAAAAAPSQTQIAGTVAQQQAPAHGEGEVLWNQVPEAPEDKAGSYANVPEANDMSRLEQFGTGLLDPLAGAARLIANIPDPLGFIPGPQQQVAAQGTAAANQALNQREQEIRAEGGDTGYRTLGQALSPATIAAGMVGGPATAGAISGALMPTESGSAREIGTNSLLGLIGGRLTGSLLGAASRVAAPAFDAAKKLLLREGVRLTPGQLAGGTAQRAENALARIPIAGALPRQAELQAFEDFNRAAANRALSPVGIQIAPNTPPGHAMVKAVRDQLSNLYNRVLPRMVARNDSDLVADFDTIKQTRRMLPPELGDELDRIIDHDVLDKFSRQGWNGQTAKAIEEDLDNAIATKQQSEKNDVRRLGNSVREVNSALDRMMQRNNPQLYPVKQQIDKGWANYKIIERAAQMLGAKEGVFTPAQLSNAVRAADETKDNRAYSHGMALLQDLAGAAKKILPDTLAGSPTAEISFWHRLLTGGPIAGALGAGAMASPVGTGVAIGTLGAANLPYTAMGRRGVNALAQPAGPGRNALSQYLSTAGQYGAAPAGVAAADVGEQYRPHSGSGAND